MNAKSRAGALANFASPNAVQTQQEPESKSKKPRLAGRPRSAPEGDLVPLQVRMTAAQRKAVRQLVLDLNTTAQTFALEAIAAAVRTAGGKWPGA